MKYNIYAVFDVKAEAYMTPFFMGSDESAKRSFQDAAQNPEMPFSRHPQDYTLFKIGAFNDHTAEIEPIVAQSQGNALELLAALRKQQLESNEILTGEKLDGSSTISNETPILASTESEHST